jgi:NAD(P)-dependent dehydrogenase (short-subunit alcohol dehydrogenase family)
MFGIFSSSYKANTMSHKITLITGATSGIGKETALALARKDHTLYLLVRDSAKGEQLKQHLVGQTGNQDIHIVLCDLADMQSVSKAAVQISERLTSINVLINNAGGIFNEFQHTTDGLEQTFATNHLSHFLLTLSLMPLLLNGQARVINVSSEAHKPAKTEWINDMQFEHKGYNAFKAYALAKLLNIYFTKSLVDHFGSRGITAYALHPGLVNTGFGEGLSGLGSLLMMLARPFMITAEEGAQTSIYLATEPGIENLTGQYFKKKQPAKISSAAKYVPARERLWQLSEDLVRNT